MERGYIMNVLQDISIDEREKNNEKFTKQMQDEWDIYIQTFCNRDKRYRSSNSSEIVNK